MTCQRHLTCEIRLKIKNIGKRLADVRIALGLGKVNLRLTQTFFAFCLSTSRLADVFREQTNIIARHYFRIHLEF